MDNSPFPQSFLQGIPSVDPDHPLALRVPVGSLRGCTVIPARSLKRSEGSSANLSLVWIEPAW
ncbi:MAG: hypothetical protein Q6M04_08625 [Thermostichus sp. BF3_bins_97]